MTKQHKKQAGDKVGFYRQVKHGDGLKTKPAEGRIEYIKNNAEGEPIVGVNFRGRIYHRKADQVYHIQKRKR